MAKIKRMVAMITVPIAAMTERPHRKQVMNRAENHQMTINKPD